MALTVEWFGRLFTTEATARPWAKWWPSEPTSPHWYGQEEFERLVSAYIAHDQDSGAERSVRELVKEFRGLTATAKQKAVLEETGLVRTNLSALVNGDSLRHDAVAGLLEAMRRHSKPVKPAMLGVIGRDHIAARFQALGCQMDSFEYRKTAKVDGDGLPVIVETAFAWRGKNAEDSRRIVTGVNWSPGIVNPFRTLGNDDSDGLAALLQERDAGRHEAIVVLVHCGCPRVRYTDRGKSAVVMNGDSIIESLDSHYFTQKILPLYVASHPDETADWDVVYDARGHFAEPHTGVIIPLGTIDVRQYVARIKSHDVGSVQYRFFTSGNENPFPTCGPKHRFSAVMFIEKEGFLPLFNATKLAERFDIAIMSTKGMPVVACRALADELCGEYGIPLLMLHDFDKAGFSMLGTLRGETKYDRNCREIEPRYQYHNEFEVIDLGLRLEDVRQHDLQTEVVYYPKSDPRENLRDNGATEEEIAFLYSGWRQGQRVELNAFASDVFVQWIESKLQANGIKKVIPDQETLREAFRRAIQLATIKERLTDIIEEAAQQAQEATIPKGLKTKVAQALKANPEIPWDQAITQEEARGELRQSTVEVTPTIPFHKGVSEAITATSGKAPRIGARHFVQRAVPERFIEARSAGGSNRSGNCTKARPHGGCSHGRATRFTSMILSHLVQAGGSRESWIWPGAGADLRQAEVIVKCEGLTDVLALASAGLPEGWVAVTNVCGAMSANPGKLDFSFAAGKRVIVVGDTDRSGQDGAEKSAAALHTAGAAEVHLPRLPYAVVADHGKDLRDWLLEGHTFQGFIDLVAQTPRWEAKRPHKVNRLSIAPSPRGTNG